MGLGCGIVRLEELIMLLDIERVEDGVKQGRLQWSCGMEGTV